VDRGEKGVLLAFGVAQPGQDLTDVVRVDDQRRLVAVEARIEHGARVFGVAPAALAARAITRVEALVPLPEGMSAEAATTVPVAFLTAVHALEECARLQPEAEREPGSGDQPPRRPPAANEFERFIGLAVLGRVGVAAVVVAAAYFGQLGWERLGPVARSVVIYLAGAAMIGVGTWLRPRVQPRFVAYLWGGGTALTYVAGVVAHLRYGVLPAPAAEFLGYMAPQRRCSPRTVEPKR
jgi:hypothetical protein